MNIHELEEKLLEEVGEHIKSTHIEGTELHIQIADGGDGFIVATEAKNTPGIGKSIDHPRQEPGQYYVFEEY